MIIFANNMQQEFLNSKENKIVIATSCGSGKTYSLYLKALTLLEEDDKSFGFCFPTYVMALNSYSSFKKRFKKYKNLRFSDTSCIVEHKKTGSKFKFVSQESCYAYETLLLDNLHNISNLNIIRDARYVYACCNASQYDTSRYEGLFDKVVTGYGICEQLKSNPDYMKCINDLDPELKQSLLKEHI